MKDGVPPPKAARKTIGNISYDRTLFPLDDAEMERKRLETIQYWNRKAIRKRVIGHLRRIADEHGLKNNVDQFFNKKGYPPPHVSLGSMLRIYRLMEKQKGWLSAINEELRARLKVLNAVRYLQDEADLKARLRARHEERLDHYHDIAVEENTPRLAPKMEAAIREAVMVEIAPKERAFISKLVPHREADLLGSRQIQKMMKFVFYDYLPEGDDSVPEDPDAQYSYLAAALNEAESQRARLQENMYELREFIESADLVARELG